MLRMNTLKLITISLSINKYHLENMNISSLLKNPRIFFFEIIAMSNVKVLMAKSYTKKASIDLLILLRNAYVGEKMVCDKIV